MDLPRQDQLEVARLGTCATPSPVSASATRFVPDSRRVLVCSTVDELHPFFDRGELPPSFEAAGPRERIFFEPHRMTCGIVTCGGLCPGLNDVIRSIVLTAHYWYGAGPVLGFRYGYQGLSRNAVSAPLELVPEIVKDIHQQGGTILGSSRGPQDVSEMVDVLAGNDVRILFAIGGDGTLRGASAIAGEIRQRGLEISVIGIPKTIDNDIAWMTQSFGFATAVEEARRAIVAAHTEARGAWNGVGLVKLMGRYSGFIAAHASLANADVNFCLVPEVAFALTGEHGFLEALERRLEEKRHAVVVVAEGAGQELMKAAGNERDPSGNVRLKDIGVALRDEIARHFSEVGKPITIKYIDPSYIIRSMPANSLDSELCLMLGQHAVHAGMAGRTDMVVASWNRHFIHVPIPLAVANRRQLDPHGSFWHRVLEATGQPALSAS